MIHQATALCMAPATESISLTTRQREVLATIARLTDSDGRPPTFREVGAELGLSSPNAVSNFAAALHRKGLLEAADRSARGLRLTPAGRTVLEIDEADELAGVKWTGNCRPVGSAVAAMVLAGHDLARQEAIATARAWDERWTLTDAPPPPYKGGPLTESVAQVLERGAAKRQKARETKATSPAAFESTVRYVLGFFNADELGGHGKHSKWFHITVGVLGKFLGREPELVDLSEGMLQLFYAWLRSRGTDEAIATLHRDRVLRVWKYAIRNQYLPAAAKGGAA